MTPDAINASFELIGAALAWLNFWRLWNDGEVKGVYWPVTAFFAVWGVWNVYYYPSLGQWLSAAAGVVLCAGNFAWVGLVLWLERRTRQRAKRLGLA
jgi:hypothetical protein